MKSYYIIIASVTLLLTQHFYGKSQSADQIIANFKANDSRTTTTADVTLSIQSASGSKRVRTIRLSDASFSGNKKQLIRFIGPADVAGTGFLSIENDGIATDNWLYLPTMGKSRRIAEGRKRESFMGTDFSYKDMEPEKTEEYKYTVMGSETIDGSECWKIEAMPKDAKTITESGYSKRILCITKDHYLIARIYFYDKNGILYKQLNSTDRKPIPGSSKWFSYVLTMENTSKKTNTVITFSNVIIEKELPANTFSVRNLESF